MWNIIINLAIPVLRWALSKRETRKLSDKEFVEFILAHQKNRQNAGQVALDFETNLEQALKKQREEELELAIIENKNHLKNSETL